MKKPIPLPGFMIPILVVGLLGFLMACVLKWTWALVGFFLFFGCVFIMVIYAVYKSDDDLGP